MSESDQYPSADAAESDVEAPLEPTVVAREDEDDHDLLTYGEVAARLSEEIAAETQRLREWQQQLATGSPVAEECDRSARRLAQLRDAQSRNRRQPITDENFEHFFGFKGQPRRNT